jgi:hypothetical protein
VELEQQSRWTCEMEAVSEKVCLSRPHAPCIAKYPDRVLNRRHGLTNHCLTVSSCTSHPSYCGHSMR